VSLWRAIGVAFATAVSAVFADKYASVPVKLFGHGSPRVEHYFYLVENDGNSAISFFGWALFLVPICAIALFVWSATRLTDARSIVIDLIFFAALICVPQLLFYGSWGAEGWYVLPVALAQSAFAVAAMTFVFRLLLAWRTAMLTGR